VTSAVDRLAPVLADAWATTAAPVGLSYLDEHFAVHGPDEIVERVAARLAPFVTRGPSRPGATEVHAVAGRHDALLARTLAEGREVVVDASLYDSNSLGRRLDLEDGHLVAIERTGTLCAFLPGAGVVVVLQPDARVLESELSRTVKAVITAGCERRGCVVVHASGVVTPAGTTLFTGDSRNGKTTILLEALSAFDTSMLSCDTCVLRAGPGGVTARGWPSNFSVSIGTIHDYPVLHALADAEHRELTYTQAWAIHPKHVLDTHDVIRAASVEITPQASVSALVALRFAPDERTGLEPIDDADAIRAALAEVCLGSRDPLYPNWHGFVDVTPETIDANLSAVADGLLAAGVEAHSMTWAPGPITLLRRVGVLEPACRSKPARSPATVAP
jgi:hypothetical protein